MPDAIATAPTPDDFLSRLKATRPGYDEELEYHRFLIDAYTGCGGFRGKVKTPNVGYWGWAGDAYSSTNAFSAAAAQVRTALTQTTYLDRFPREDDRKFARRIDVAWFANYCEPTQDLYVSYLLKRPMNRGEDLPESLDDWMQDVDGRGTTWDELEANVIVPRMATCGWTPVLFDMTPAPEKLRGQPITRQQQKDHGITARAIPLFPANLLAWALDDAGHFLWAKIRTDHIEHDDALTKPVRIERYAIWDRANVRYWDVRYPEGGGPIIGGEQKDAHPFKQVPLAIFRCKPTPDDPVRGISLIGQAAVLNRRHFNLLSELDEHLRGQVFAILQVPVEGMDKIPSEVTGGADNCLPIPMGATQGYAFIAPPGSVAATYEKRIESVVQEIYRIMRLEYSRPTGGATSGVAHAYEFEATNRKLGDLASQVARGEAWSVDIVCPALGVSDTEREKIRISGPTEFDVEDLAAELDNVQRAIGLGLGPTAQRLIRLRTINKLLPNLDDADRDDIETELEEAAGREADMAAMTAEIDAAGNPVQDDPDADPSQVGEKPVPGGPVKPAAKRSRRNGGKPAAKKKSEGDA